MINHPKTISLGGLCVVLFIIMFACSEEKSDVLPPIKNNPKAPLVTTDFKDTILLTSFSVEHYSNCSITDSKTLLDCYPELAHVVARMKEDKQRQLRLLSEEPDPHITYGSNGSTLYYFEVSSAADSASQTVRGFNWGWYPSGGNARIDGGFIEK